MRNLNQPVHLLFPPVIIALSIAVVAVALPSGLPWPLPSRHPLLLPSLSFHCPRAIHCHCRCAVHCRPCHCITVAPSVAVITIAFADVASNAVTAVAAVLPSRLPLPLLLLRCGAVHCRHHRAIHCHCGCRVVITPSIAVALPTRCLLLSLLHHHCAVHCRRVAVMSPPHRLLPLPLRRPWPLSPSCCRRAIHHRCYRAVHFRCCRQVAVAPSIAAMQSITVAIVPYTAVVAVPSPSRLPSPSPSHCPSPALLSCCPYTVHCPC